jgi:hypothetical protein
MRAQIENIVDKTMKKLVANRSEQLRLKEKQHNRSRDLEVRCECVLLIGSRTGRVSRG